MRDKRNANAVVTSKRHRRRPLISHAIDFENSVSLRTVRARPGCGGISPERPPREAAATAVQASGAADSPAGHLVTRDDIRAELWTEGTFVDFDQAVNFAIKQI